MMRMTMMVRVVDVSVVMMMVVGADTKLSERPTGLIEKTHCKQSNKPKKHNGP